MNVYLYQNNTEKILQNAYIGIPYPESISLDKSSINLTTIGQTEQLTATIEPTVSDKTITWTSSDDTIATVSTTGLVTCVNPGSCTITATTVNGLTASCGVINVSGWRPDPTRTIFYYDFENNLNDTSGNNNNIIASSNIGYEQIGGQYVSSLTAGNGYLQVSSTVGSSIGSGDFTISFWMYLKQPVNSRYPMLFGIFNDTYPFTGPNIFFDPYNIIGGGDKIQRRTDSPTQAFGATSASSLYNGWHHLVMTRNSGTVTCYLDTNVEATWNNDTNGFPTSSNSSGYVLFANNGTSQKFGVTGVKGDKVILEKVGWSSQDVADYFNSTKSIYGIN